MATNAGIGFGIFHLHLSMGRQTDDMNVGFCRMGHDEAQGTCSR